MPGPIPEGPKRQTENPKSYTYLLGFAWTDEVWIDRGELMLSKVSDTAPLRDLEPEDGLPWKHSLT